MQTALSSIWIRVAVSVSYGDNHYTQTASIRDPYMNQIDLFENYLGWKRMLDNI